MASSMTRRPLPAIIALLALLLLTALVWWRVLNRGGGTTNQAGGTSCTPSATSTVTSPATSTSSPSSSPGGGHPRPASALPAPSSVTVRVLNSTSRGGIAGKAQAALVQDGFHSPGQAANDEKHHNKIKNVAQIRYGRGERSGARLLRYYFPGATLMRVHLKHHVVVVSLGAKYRRVESAAAVQAALRADRLSVSGSPTPTHASPSC